MGLFDALMASRGLSTETRERLLSVAEPASRHGDVEALRGFLKWREPTPLLVDLPEPAPIRDAARQLVDDDAIRVRIRAAFLLLELRDEEGLWLKSRDASATVDRQVREFLLGKLRRLDDEILLRGYDGGADRGVAMTRMRAFADLAEDRPRLAKKIAKQALPNPEVPKEIRKHILRCLPDHTFHPAKLEALLAQSEPGLAGALIPRLAESPKDWPALEKRIRSGGVHPGSYVSRVACKPRGKAWVQRLARDLDDGALIAEVLHVVGAQVDDGLVRRGLSCSEPRGRAKALRLAVARRSFGGYELALRGLSDPAKEVQWHALNALVEIGDLDALPAMRALIDEGDEYDERYNPHPVGQTAASAVRRLEAKGGA